MKKILIYLLLLSVVLCGCGQTSYLSTQSEDISTESSSEIVEDRTVSGYVQIAGAVKNPGVYEINDDTRLFMVIEKAGGLNPDADIRSLNQAGILKDGESIYIQTIEEAKEAALNEELGINTEDIDGKVNLNTADMERLMTLPGIGQSKAKQIIDYRETNGSFSSIEEIMEIQGIKEGVFSKIKDSIKV